jgi:hypothetical protein
MTRGIAIRFGAAAAVVPLALAAVGCGDEGSPASKLEKKSLSAAIVDSPNSFFAGKSLKPISNAWRTSDRKRFTQVEAGAVPGEASNGAFVIFRHDFNDARQDAKVVKVLGAGTLKITKAPTGESVESSAQHTGKIVFSSESGIGGRLDLKDDSIHLKAP